MSDFLSHLVARSLGLAPAPDVAAVRPRLASRFEPRLEPRFEVTSPAAAPPVEETMEEWVPAAPASRIEHLPAEPAASRPAPHPPVPSPSRPPGEGGGRQGRRDFDQGPVFLPSPVGREGDGRGAGGEGSTPPPPSQAGLVIRPLPGEESRRRAEPPPPSPEPAHRDPIPEPPAPPVPERRPRVEPVVRRVEVERVFTPIPPPPAVAPAAPPVAPPAAPAQAAPAVAPAPPILQPRVQAVERDLFPARREEPAAEPVIHVTIGRIEVRATPAPKAPARERQPARPAVDLEEYLRQRAKGEGR